MRPLDFVQVLRSAAFENVFNPYADRCELYDVEDAPQRRCRALVALLVAAGQTNIDSLWVGRDLGYRGGRRTGLALTDDVHIDNHAARWGVEIERATAGPMMAERTAAVIWKAIAKIGTPIFLWNVFPFHPYEPDDPFTNRSHNSNERIMGEEFLAELIGILKPRRLIALGNDAAGVAARLAGKRDVIKVRHPSYGGQQKFMAQVQSLYGFDITR
jgi:Uracil DNA glycosylase superfamily